MLTPPLGGSQLLQRIFAASPLLRVDQASAANDQRRLATSGGHHRGMALLGAGNGVLMFFQTAKAQDKITS